MDVGDAVRRTYITFREAKIPFLAASIAFYAFLSIIPLLLLTLAIGSLVGGEDFAVSIVSLIEDFLSPEGAEIVETALASPEGRQGASIVSILALTWSALKVFRSIDVAFDTVYRAGIDTSLLSQLVNALIVLATIALGATLMVGLGTLVGLPTLVAVPYVNVIGWLALIAGLVIVFLPFFYVMPPVDVSLTEVLPGTIVVSVGWIVLQFGFQIYAANAGQYQAYGFLGAIFLFLIWLYFSSMLVLLGAAINAVLGGHEPAT